MFFRSIRWRLQVWHSLILLVVLTGFGFTAHQLNRGNEMRRVDQDINSRLSILLDTLRGPGPQGGPPGRGFPPPGPEPHGPPGGPEGDEPPPPREFRLPADRASAFENGSNSYYYIVWTREGKELARSAGAPPAIPPPDGNGLAAGRNRGSRSRGILRELYTFTPPGECLLAGRSMAPELANLRRSSYWLAGLGAGVMILGLAGGWWLAARAIRPIEDISAAATQIATGDLSHRIAATDTDTELGRLAAVLNSTFSRLDAAFTHQAQFTSDASHELRTPVSVILTQTQTALARERSAADYRETLEACQRAAQRMRRLIESLLELARLDAGQDKMKRETFDLARVVQDSIDLVRPLAAARKIEVRCSLDAAHCIGDPERIAQVVVNLLTNAIHHNKESGEVKIGARADNRTATITISDGGPGIAPKDLPHIFERFYRADSSRTAATGGAGLGLAIAKAIVDGHGGTIKVESELGAGATFTVRLPVAAAHTALS